jgi:hypothetical protein
MSVYFVTRPNIATISPELESDLHMFPRHTKRTETFFAAAGAGEFDDDSAMVNVCYCGSMVSVVGVEISKCRSVGAKLYAASVRHFALIAHLPTD